MNICYHLKLTVFFQINPLYFSKERLTTSKNHKPIIAFRDFYFNIFKSLSTFLVTLNQIWHLQIFRKKPNFLKFLLWCKCNPSKITNKKPWKVQSVIMIKVKISCSKFYYFLIKKIRSYLYCVWHLVITKRDLKMTCSYLVVST